ncbi:hypothetical protein [Microtetraspora malaysiensis]|uniref:ANTAR domain-containing protein n=1 Tax=Microtetraspora malaysiensis TaxID=161358 RepID=A0ABW6SZI3_9ACTN
MLSVTAAAIRNADDRTTIDTAVRLLFFAPVTSETRAAAYRLLASTPGVAAVGQVTDALAMQASTRYPGRPRPRIRSRTAQTPAGRGMSATVDTATDT